MRTLIWLFISAGWILSQNARAATNNTAVDSKLITSFGSHSAAGGLLTINVPGWNGKWEVTRGKKIESLTVTNPAIGQVSYAYKGFVTNTVSSESWRAHTNWFVFVENESRVWCYDGNASLDLVLEDAVGTSLIAGPGTFPCAVPEEVRKRLPDAVKKKIKAASKTER
jgi:hypothetical protein